MTPVVFEHVHAALLRLWATAKIGTAVLVVFEPVHAALNSCSLYVRRLSETSPRPCRELYSRGHTNSLSQLWHGKASLAPRPGKLAGLSMERAELLCIGEATQARILSLCGSLMYLILPGSMELSLCRQLGGAPSPLASRGRIHSRASAARRL